MPDYIQQRDDGWYFNTGTEQRGPFQEQPVETGHGDMDGGVFSRQVGATTIRTRTFQADDQEITVSEMWQGKPESGHRLSVQLAPKGA